MPAVSRPTMNSVPIHRARSFGYLLRLLNERESNITISKLKDKYMERTS
ncbi:MAG: hypothetical protein VB142_03830 [Burkholderia sp.]